MERELTLRYIIVTIVAAGLGVVGAYLPWVQKRPVHIDGQLVSTSEYVGGSETGIQGLDPFIISLGIAAVAVVSLAQFRDWNPDIVLIGAGVLTLVISGDRFHSYWSVERYGVELGLYLVLVSGLLYIIVGAGAFFKRHIATPTAKNSDSKVS